MKTKNLTPFLFGAKLTARRPPELEMTTIVRGSFRLAPDEPVTALDEIPLLSQGSMSAETYRDDDLDRSGECLYCGDFADFKLNAEVMLRGTCHAPGGNPVPSCAVKLGVGDWSKILRVSGRRVWSDGFSGAAMSQPIPFTTMPIDYAGAFGGPGYAANPVGRGFGTSEVPSVELARELVRSRADRPTPAGFGPINPAWPPRNGKLGKEYGRAYREKRAPFYAEDFDWTYFQAAPADQQLVGYLRGDEEIVLQNLHPTAAVLAARLPGIRIRVFVNDVNGLFREVRMNLDTLFVDPDAQTLYLTWRGLDRVTEDDLTDVKTVLIASEKLGEAALPPAHYRSLLTAFEADPIEIRSRVSPASRETFEKLKARSSASEAEAHAASEPAPDAVTGRLRGSLDLLDLETRGRLEREVSGGFAAIRGASGPDADVIGAFEKSVAALSAESPKTAMPRKPGVVPALPLGGKLREAREAIVEARKKAAAQGADVSELERLEALFSDPRLAALDPASREGAEPPVEPGPGRDLTGRDFTGADLRGRDLRGAIFDGAILTRADLRGACLVGANLKHAVLLEAELEGADLSGADLTEANLTEVRAPRVDLSRATLSRVYARNGSLAGACLAGATGDLAFFTGVDLTGANARGVRFFKTLFRDCDLAGADFADARLTRCYFLGSRAASLRLASAELHHTSFAGSDLSRARLDGARGTGTIWLGTILDGADLGFTVLPAAHFTGARGEGTRFFGANLKGARFYRASLTNADFTRSNLFGADLSRAIVTGARFTDASLYDAKFLKTAGSGCDFSGANLKRSTLEGA